MALDKIYIPTFISSVNYDPTRVLPHVYFYNGMKDTNTYFVEYLNSGSVASSGLSAFPYFDNYQGNNPTTSSRTLLFNNETAPYGEMPSESLYSEYWEKYVTLLYSPTTRIFDCEAIIPLADYFKMELNDIVEWRGNYYHLRAINDYNLSNGECNLQLLGPVLTDVISNILPVNDCNFNFSITNTTPPTVSFYQADMQNGLSRTVYYTDYNGIARSYAFNPVRSYKFAAQSGSVSFSNSLGCTLTTISNSFTPNFREYYIWFGPDQLPTYYLNLQEPAGNITTLTNYNWGGNNICLVSGSITSTGNTLWHISDVGAGNCTPEPTNKTITITLTEKIKKAGPDFEVYYSDDCNTYTYLQTIKLANIGASVDVTVPYNSSCIKLVSTGECGNSVVHVIPGALGGDFNIDFSFLDFNVY